MRSVSIIVDCSTYHSFVYVVYSAENFAIIVQIYQGIISRKKQRTEINHKQTGKSESVSNVGVSK